MFWKELGPEGAWDSRFAEGPGDVPVPSQHFLPPRSGHPAATQPRTHPAPSAWTPGFPGPRETHTRLRGSAVRSACPALALPWLAQLLPAWAMAGPAWAGPRAGRGGTVSTGPLVPREPSSSPAWTPPRTTRSAQAPELPPRSPPPPPTVTGPTPPVHPVSCRLTARSLEAHPQPAPECVASGARRPFPRSPWALLAPHPVLCVGCGNARARSPGCPAPGVPETPRRPDIAAGGGGDHSAVAGEAWCLQPREAVFAQFFSDRKMPAVPRNGT